MEYLKAFIKTILQTIPLYALFLAVFIALCVLLGAVLITVLRRYSLWNVLGRVIAQPDSAGTLISNRYSDRFLLRNSGLIERFARKGYPHIVKLTGIGRLWTERLIQKKRKGDFLRVLQFSPETGLFKCFLVSLEKRGLARHLLNWIEQAEDYLALQKLALSGRGEDFNGRKAAALLHNWLQRIREMTGDPEWASRYFSLKILLHDGDEKSVRAVWDGLKDTHPLIRMTVVREFVTDERGRLASELGRLFLRDPAFEVRRTAWARIQGEFLDLHSIDPKKLSHEEVIHLLELLRPGSKEDENVALQHIEGEDLELRFIAAQFLELCGTLERMILEVDLGDREGLERNFSLLSKASQVNVTSFLVATERTDNPASLLIAARILKENGNRPLITHVAKKVFRMMDARSGYMEIYEATLNSISVRGNDEALRLLDRELFKRKSSRTHIEPILNALPGRSDSFFLDTLFLFLRDPEFPAKKALREALERMPASLVLPEILAILRAGRTYFPHAVRILALMVLGEMKLPYCFQTVLENLPTLPLNEARQLARVLSSFPMDVFIEKTKCLLESSDSKVRSALVSCLPATGKKDFLPFIRECLKDADPQVRIASVWALVEYNDTRTLNRLTSMLRDPLERVRVETAKALGANGSDFILESLRETLIDKNELETVKQAAIIGLGSSGTLSSIDILIEGLDSETSLDEQLTRALAEKTEKQEVAHLIERFRGAVQSVRDKLKEVFKAMGERGEPALVELLKEENPSLHSFLAEILEDTGFVESAIRGLSHREMSVRREAAEVLCLVATESAYRGIVIAARDPDDEVRVKVVKALERLETEEGKKILSSLSHDPERRIRRYTHWALERLKAKAL